MLKIDRNQEFCAGIQVLIGSAVRAVKQVRNWDGELCVLEQVTIESSVHAELVRIEGFMLYALQLTKSLQPSSLT